MLSSSVASVKGCVLDLYMYNTYMVGVYSYSTAVIYLNVTHILSTQILFIVKN